MKKHISLFVCAIAAIAAAPAGAATNVGARAASSADLSGVPATRARQNINYEKYETRTTTRTYDMRDGTELYYTQPSSRSALYKEYDNTARNGQTTAVRTTRAETVRSSVKRKYFLAHPFYQPLRGKFGSVTDFGYSTNTYDLTLRPVAGNGIDMSAISDTKAKWSEKTFSIKEDFSYGITDTIALQAMAKYDVSKYKLDWSEAPDDKDDDNGINLWGFGGQWRFVDNADWIGMASAYYQHQKDVSNNFILELKAGYKVARSTIYGLGRAWYLNFDGNSYGNGIEGTTAEGVKQTLYIAYKEHVDHNNSFYVEGGLGVFSVLDEDWTLNVEAIFGDYDWHNQASIKGAIGWQPNDWFALNLYAKTTIYDSANDKKLGYWTYGAEVDGIDETHVYIHDWVKLGEAKLSKYSETSIGLQAIFQF